MKKLWHKITSWYSSLRIKYILWRADRVLLKAYKKAEKAKQEAKKTHRVV